MDSIEEGTPLGWRSANEGTMITRDDTVTAEASEGTALVEEEPADGVNRPGELVAHARRKHVPHARIARRANACPIVAVHLSMCFCVNIAA
jgi:hypothetical protein